MDAWFYVTEGRTEGPLSIDELRQRLATGTVAPTTLVWEPTMPGWQPAGTVAILQRADAGDLVPRVPPVVASVAPLPVLTEPAIPASPHTVPTHMTSSLPTGPSASPAGDSESGPAKVLSSAAGGGAGANQAASQLVASIRRDAPRRVGVKPRSRWIGFIKFLGSLTLLALVVLGVLSIPGVKPRLQEALAEVIEKVRSTLEKPTSLTGVTDGEPVVIPPLADPAAGTREAAGNVEPSTPDATPGATADSAGANSSPGAVTALYRCPLEAMNAEVQAPRLLGSFQRTDLRVEEPNTEKQWAYFYTCRYQHPKGGTIGHKVLSFEKYRGDSMAAEYARAAVNQVQSARRLIHQEDVVTPKGAARLGRIYVLSSASGSDVIWNNGRHFLHIEAPTTALALEFKKLLAY
jgi:hypothetical protein